MATAKRMSNAHHSATSRDSSALPAPPPPPMPLGAGALPAPLDAAVLEAVERLFREESSMAEDHRSVCARTCLPMPRSEGRRDARSALSGAMSRN
jgi:hypothetical protein